MKTIATLSCLLLSLALPSLGFVHTRTNQVLVVRAPHYSPVLLQSIMRDDIAQELRDLGKEIKKHVFMHKPAEFDELQANANANTVTESSTIHRLRDEINERDVQYRKMIQELQETVAGLAILLETEVNALQAEENVLEQDIKAYEEENESVRHLLAQAAKLTRRRIAKPFHRVLHFLRLKKKE